MDLNCGDGFRGSNQDSGFKPMQKQIYGGGFNFCDLRLIRFIHPALLLSRFKFILKKSGLQYILNQYIMYTYRPMVKK